MSTLRLIPSITDRVIAQAEASNLVSKNRHEALRGLNRLNNVELDSLSPAMREQCSTRVGAAMVVYGN